jgi:integrase
MKIMLKCWSVEKLTLIKLESYVPIFNYVKEIMSLTSNFKREKVNDVNDLIIKNIPLTYKREVAFNLVNFLDFCSIETSEDYINELELLKDNSSIKVQSNTRSLPLYEDVLYFQHIIEDFMKKEDEDQKIKYYPIYIWWKITSIIPMRIGEFCAIQRKCTIYEDGKYYIKIPRSKKRKTDNKIEVLDTIEIDKNTFLLIDKYIDITNEYGKTGTLISYRAYKNFFGDDTINLSSNFFNRHNFSYLLNKFYDEIVNRKYKINNIEKIKPNDTRHFAFCSLMLQGFNALTIARLGGHSSLESQNHYQRHLDYFIQSKVYELSRIYKLNQMNEFKKNSHSHELKNLEINSLQSKTNFSYLEKMDIGYCTDPKMDCESEYCQLCTKFWIPRDELRENYEELFNFKKSYEKRIKERIETMNRIRKGMEYDINKNNHSIDEQEKLFREAKLLETEINGLAKINNYFED